MARQIKRILKKIILKLGKKFLSVLALIFTAISLIISRFFFKGILYSWDSFQIDRKNILIYGAGRAGVQISESLKKTNDYKVVGFIDDDSAKVSTLVNSIEVYDFKSLNSLIVDESVKNQDFEKYNVHFGEQHPTIVVNSFGRFDEHSINIRSPFEGVHHTRADQRGCHPEQSREVQPWSENVFL